MINILSQPLNHLMTVTTDENMVKNSERNLHTFACNAGSHGRHLKMSNDNGFNIIRRLFSRCLPKAPEKKQMVFKPDISIPIE